MLFFKKILFLLILLSTISFADSKKLAYIVSDIRIPFWDIMARGIKSKSNSLGYEIVVYTSHNNRKEELQSLAKAIKSKVDGIIISPTSSSASVTLLHLAKKANIPVVISDIGTDEGEYVSYISSDNEDGAYKLGLLLAKKMIELNWQKGKVGIISIPQKRINGQLRTKGFLRALAKYSIKTADLKQQVDFSYKETYDFSKELIKNHRDLRAIWLQGSDRYEGALDAIKDSGKSGEILLICFDAEPIFLDLIPKGVLVGAGMQQPYLMGQEAVKIMDRHLKEESVEKNIKLEVLAISKDNIKEKLPTIKRNVLGIEK